MRTRERIRPIEQRQTIQNSEKSQILPYFTNKHCLHVGKKLSTEGI